MLWIKKYYNLYTYSIDIKKCKNISYCKLSRAKEAFLKITIVSYHLLQKLRINTLQILFIYFNIMII